MNHFNSNPSTVFLFCAAPYYVSPSTTSGTDKDHSPSTNLLSIIFDWTSVKYSMYSFQGIMTAASYALTSLVMALCMWKVMKRSSKCADFSCTMYFLHVIACWLYNKDSLGFPRSVPFWFCMIASGVTTAVVAERLCMREELEEIPLSQFVKTREQGKDTILLMQGGTTASDPR